VNPEKGKDTGGEVDCIDSKSMNKKLPEWDDGSLLKLLKPTVA
jgi:hypothetical protein